MNEQPFDRAMISFSEDFPDQYIRSIALSSIVFGFSHGIEIFAVALMHAQHPFQINPTGLPVLIFIAALEAIVFFVVGGVAAYWPSYLAIRFLERQRSGRLWYVFSGVVVAIASLPLCAGVPLLINLPDEPTYFSRCLEFALPMMLAGGLGGLFYWRYVRREIMA